MQIIELLKKAKENLCSKLEDWGTDSIILAKTIGIFIMLVISVLLMMIEIFCGISGFGIGFLLGWWLAILIVYEESNN